MNVSVNLKNLIRHRSRRSSVGVGFTVVELIIVISIIAILAGIVVVAYPNWKQTTITNQLKNDLNGAMTAMENARTFGNAYPTSLPSTFTPSSGDTIAFGSTSTTSNYCIQVANSSYPTMTYYYDSTSSSSGIQSGACSNPVTNLFTNPSLESSSVGTTTWSYWAGTSTGVAAASLKTDGGAYGNNYLRITWSVSPTDNTGNVGSSNGSTPASAGTTYTASMSVRSSISQRLALSIYYYNSSGTTLSTNTGANVVVSAGVWTRFSKTAVAPANTASMNVRVGQVAGTGAQIWSNGNTLDGDGLMIVQGSTLYNYADGSYPNWFWNGTVSNSTSTGPPQ